MSLPDINTLEDLMGPYEILELGDRGTKELVIERYQLGRMMIHPRPAGTPKLIITLRVWVPARIKPLYPDYYDITSQTLIAQMLPALELADYNRRVFTIQKFGTGASARFTLAVA